MTNPDPGLEHPIEKPTRQPGLRHGLSIITDRNPELTRPLQAATDAQLGRWARIHAFGWYTDQDGLPKASERGRAAIAALNYLQLAKERNIYMVRWLLARVFGWEFKFNLFLSSDPGCLHDHPWPFVSVMLAGSYREISEIPSPTEPHKTIQLSRIYRAPCILFRPARWKHRITITEPCLTFNISAPRQRNWGFWTHNGWLPWAKYVDGKHEC